MGVRVFRYLLRTPGVEPLAGFSTREEAEAYRQETLKAGYDMPLEVVDQQKEIWAFRAKEDLVEGLIKTIKKIMSEEEV